MSRTRPSNRRREAARLMADVSQYRTTYMERSDVIFDNPRIEEEFLRWVEHFGTEDPYHSDETIGMMDVLRAHFLIIDYFYSKDTGLGGIGPRDPDLLHSAVYRQFVSFGGEDKWGTSFERAATLLFGVVTDHPFHDANKRTGLLVLLLFLNKINRVPTIGQNELEDFAVEISDHKLGKYARYRQLKKKTPDAEVLFIADFLKRKSRKLDRKFYSITYRELDRRLQDFGYRLKNPHKNFIDVVRVEEKRKLFGFGGKEQVDVKVAQVGFPGWKCQVNQGAVSTIRKEARLTAEYGFDSQSFYQGADPVQSLIAEYSGPLERLAYR